MPVFTVLARRARTRNEVNSNITSGVVTGF